MIDRFRKALPLDFLHSLGLTTINFLNQKAVRIPYFGPDGSETAARICLSLSGLDKFRWKKGDKSSLYGLSRLPEAFAEGYIVRSRARATAIRCGTHDTRPGGSAPP